MKIGTLKDYLKDIINDGYGNYTLNFSDQDGDYYCISDIYTDDDDDVYLNSDGCGEMTAQDILDELNSQCYCNRTYIYVYDEDEDLNFDIEGGWYIDDDDDLVLDVNYSYCDDDDD